MDLPFLLAAVERGDDVRVFEFLEDAYLDRAVRDRLAGEDGVILLEAAARAGRHEVVDRLVVQDVDPARPWSGGVDPVTWAAANGAYRTVNALLGRERDPLGAGSAHRRALRVARAALEAPDAAAGAGRVPPPAHRAVITGLEAKLGIERTPDELMARALVHADPEHDDWFASVLRIALPESGERFDWARAVVEGSEDAEDTEDAEAGNTEGAGSADGSGSLDRRRFALDVINFLGFGFDPDAPDGPPFAREAVDFLRPRLATERDPHALRAVLAAFSGYCTAAELPAVLVHAEHPDRDVRRCLVHDLASLAAGNPRALTALLRLADDPSPVTRTSALHGLARSPVDTPEVRAVLATHLADPDVEARLGAAAALLLRGDDRGTPVVEEIRRGVRNRASRGAGSLEDLHYQLLARTDRERERERQGEQQGEERRGQERERETPGTPAA
ncbi:HEAT repeat domain-containing protein [Kitasatospora sp. NPDC093550]|uniref:HEAT repeat domain-containing protein n=1 Tax=Kitasatospora sp. NPDC093550 TaxID=3364089 RepID=UPI003803BFFC